MAVQVGELFHKLTLDDKDFKKGMKNAEGNANNLASTLKKGLADAAKIGAAGIAATSAALLNATKDTMDYADEIDKTSQKMGLNYEQTQKWNYVASQMGTNLKSLERGLGRFQKNVNDAAEGTGMAADAIETLGIDVTDANGDLKDMNTLFPETVKKMQGMEDTAKRNALAMELFGRGGKDLIPILNSTSGSVDELMQRAEDLGIVMDEDNIQQGVKLKDTLDDVSKAYDGLKRMIGIELMPVMQGFADYMISNLPTIREKVANLIEKAKGLSDNFIAVANTGKLVYDVLKLAFESVADVLTQAVFGVMTLVEAYQFLSNSVQLAMRKVELFVAKMVNSTIQQLGKLRDVPGMGWAGDLADNSENALNMLQDNVSNLEGKIAGNMSKIKGNALALGDFFKESGERVKDNLDAIMKDFDAFGNSFDINEILTSGDGEIKPLKLGEGIDTDSVDTGGNGGGEETTDTGSEDFTQKGTIFEGFEQESADQGKKGGEAFAKQFNGNLNTIDLMTPTEEAVEGQKEVLEKQSEEEKAWVKVNQEFIREQIIKTKNLKSEAARKAMSRLIEQQATEKEMLQLKMKRELEANKNNEQAKWAIKQYYQNEIDKLEEENNQKSIERFKERFKFIKTGFANAFSAILQGTKSVTEAFGDMWTSIIDKVMDKLAEMAASKVFGFITGGGGGGFLGGIGDFFGGIFHDGGTVPGPIGQERLILAQAGETVSPIGSNTGSSGGGYKTANIMVSLDGKEIAKAVKQPLVDSIRIKGGARY